MERQERHREGCYLISQIPAAAEGRKQSVRRKIFATQSHFTFLGKDFSAAGQGMSRSSFNYNNGCKVEGEMNSGSEMSVTFPDT